METIKDILQWALIAFVFGSVMMCGAKTVDHFWPDKPIEVNYTVSVEE